MPPSGPIDLSLKIRKKRHIEDRTREPSSPTPLWGRPAPRRGAPRPPRRGARTRCPWRPDRASAQTANSRLRLVTRFLPAPRCGWPS